MVLVVLGVVGVVVTSWRTRPEEVLPPPPAATSDPGVVALTEDLDWTSIINGVRRYTLEAGERTGFRDGRSVFGDEVKLVIYGEPSAEGEAQETTTVVATGLELRERVAATEEDRYEEIRLVGDVRANLPGGVDLSTELLNYADGHLSTSEGVFLRVGGLVIEAKEFRHDPETDLGEVWGAHSQTRRPELAGDVKLWGDDSAIGDETQVVPDLAAHSRRLRYRAREGALSLIDHPIVELPDATLVAYEIDFEIDLESNRIRSIEARETASATWLTASAPGDHILRGDLITVEMDADAVPTGLRVTARDDSPRPRFDLGDSGVLRAAVIELSLAEEGAGQITASGQPLFFPAEESGYLREIGAGVLRVGADGLEEMVAEQDVVIKVSDGGGPPATLSGPRAVFSFADGAFLAADWPAGVRFESEQQNVEAAHGSFDPATENWILDGIPRPRLLTDDYDVEAGEMVLGSDGRVTLSGRVRATLRGEVIRTVAPLFGDATEIEAEGAVLEVTADGRLVFSEGARISQGSQLVQAEEIKLLPGTDELQASGGVLASFLDPEADSTGDEPPGTVVFTGDRMLVAGSPPELILIGSATLEGANSRTISGEHIQVQFLEEGGWETIEVRTLVVMTDPAGEAKGDRLEYDSETGIVAVYAGQGAQATFSNGQGIDIQDAEGLQLRWDEAVLEVTAMQKGTTQTVRAGQR